MTPLFVIMKKYAVTFFVNILASFIAFAAFAGDGGAMRSLLSGSDARLDSIFFGQKQNTRLDMIDYFDAGSRVFSHDDLFDTPIRIDSLDDRHVRFVTDSPVVIDSYLVTQGVDSLVVSVVALPIGAGDVSVFVDDVRSGKTVDTPVLRYTEWLVPKVAESVGYARIIAAVPFVTSSAAVDTQDGTITLLNNAVTVPGLDPDIVAAFRPQITLRWNGRKYLPVK